ncbi:TVP38/TMEM64 family protein [Jiella sp. M17.18]|uniref:TVP38/TMEM64 family protein n=1 Tax=Jiella sp. M17.18 TaxID=3234247 RepID=UPI0034DF2E7B
MESPREMPLWRRLLPLALLAAFLALGYAFGLQRLVSLDSFLDSRAMLRETVENHTALAAAGFVALYATLVAVSFPAASLVTVAGGFLFGWLLGGVLTVVGATIGATALFLAARYAVGDFLRRRTGGALKRFAEGFRDDAFAYLLVLRLTPALPFFAVNIAPAFFDISLTTYVAATFLGIIPGSLVYAFLGSGLDESLMRAADHGVGLSSLVTPEVTIALFGLAALGLAGLVLKKTVLRRRPGQTVVKAEGL